LRKLALATRTLRPLLVLTLPRASLNRTWLGMASRSTGMASGGRSIMTGCRYNVDRRAELLKRLRTPTICHTRPRAALARRCRDSLEGITAALATSGCRVLKHRAPLHFRSLVHRALICSNSAYTNDTAIYLLLLFVRICVCDTTRNTSRQACRRRLRQHAEMAVWLGHGPHAAKHGR